MKLTFNRKKFINALIIGGGYAGNKKFLPILECVRINTKDNICWITSYDNENAIKTKCEIEYSEEPKSGFCINYSGLYNYVYLMDTEEFDIDVDMDKMESFISNNKGYCRFPIWTIDEYPTLKSESNAPSFKLDAVQLFMWMEKASPFIMNSDELFPERAHLNLFVKDGKINVWAFNGFIAYHDEIEYNTDIDTIVSFRKSVFSGIQNAIRKEDEIEIMNGENNIVIKTQNSFILIRKMEFKYSPYHKLLQYPIRTEVFMERESFKNSIQRAQQVVGSGYCATSKFTFSPNQLVIDTENPMIGKKLVDTFEVNNECNTSVIMDTKNILTAISCITSNKLKLSTTGESTVSFLKNMDSNELTIVAPCRS